MAAQAPAPPSTRVVSLRSAVEVRGRLEHLADDFRASPGDLTAVSFRSLVSAEAERSAFLLAVEVEDGRAYASDTAPLNTTHVNTVELLGARLGLRSGSAFAEGDALVVTAGRLTMNVGSRRLVARNAFRNTINGFTGLDVSWTSPGRHTVRGFALLPVTRRPSSPAALADNEIERDREDTDALLSGLFYASAPLAGATRLELYVLHLHEADGVSRASADRRLLTPGLRVLRAPAEGAVDFQLELMAQTGTSRATSAPADVTDLDHFAISGHASAGYTLTVPWPARLALVYDFATGDRDPTDEENNRFDPLFGARRFELGPTGFFGAFARSNVRSPGLQLEADPWERVSATLAYRLFWLSASRDSWTTAAVRDPAGASGTFLGHQVETSVRAGLIPGRLALEAGGAWIARGGFAEIAPGGRASSPLYGYLQLTFTASRS